MWYTHMWWDYGDCVTIPLLVLVCMGGGECTRGLCTLGHTVSACCVSSFIICCNCSISVDDAKQDNHSMGAEPRKVWSSRENLIAEITTLRVCMLPWKLNCHPHLTSSYTASLSLPQDQVNHLQQQNQELRRRSMSPRESGPTSGTFSHSASQSPRRPLSYELEHPLTGTCVGLSSSSHTVAKMMSTLQSRERGVLVMRIAD